tara:strand:- start:83 stop:436 length:354 start_codon:yes stop_codon:yes gene_type:complete
MIRLALIATLFVFAPLQGWADVYPLDTEAIGKAPKKHGVYRLYRQSELIYIGKAVAQSVTIHRQLGEHMRGDAGACTQSATHYNYEVRHNIVSMHRLYLEHYRATHGKLPKCNSPLQ